MRSDYTHICLTAGIGVLFIALVTALYVWDERHQQELIAGGQCFIEQEAWYTPSATTTCTYYNSQGVCGSYHTSSPDPYMRSYWNCGETKFWRRKE